MNSICSAIRQVQDALQAIESRLRIALIIHEALLLLSEPHLSARDVYLAGHTIGQAGLEPDAPAGRRVSTRDWAAVMLASARRCAMYSLTVSRTVSSRTVCSSARLASRRCPLAWY